MAKALDIGKANAPRHLRQAPEYLSVDEIPDAAEAEDDGGRDRQNIQYLAKFDTVKIAKQNYPDGTAEDQSVRCKTSDPDAWNKQKVVVVKLPFIVDDDECPAADKHSDSEEYGQVEDRGQRKAKALAVSQKK